MALGFSASTNFTLLQRATSYQIVSHPELFTVDPRCHTDFFLPQSCCATRCIPLSSNIFIFHMSRNSTCWILPNFELKSQICEKSSQCKPRLTTLSQSHLTIALLYWFFRILEVLIEKGSAAVSCDANRTKTVCRTVEHMNSLLLNSIT